MGYEQRSNESSRLTLRSISIVSRDGKTFSGKGRNAVLDGTNKFVAFIDEDGDEHYIHLAPGDEVSFHTLEKPMIVPVGGKIDVVN